MKKVFNSFFVIVAAMITLAGCTKQETDAPETKNVQFFAQSIETKTVFGALADDGKTYPTLWNSGDKLKVLLNIEQVSGTEKTAEVECDDLAESAYFEVAFSPSVKPETYTYYAVSPSTAFNGKSSNDGRITVVIPTEQTPLETSVDKSAQIIYAVAPADADQTSVDMHFHHLTAYGKFSLTNLTDEVSSVSKVKIVAPDGVYISGKWNYLVNTEEIAVHTKDISNQITINTTRTEDIWFSCGPVDVSGKTFKFVVTTDKGDLEREVTFPAGRKFESGKIAQFSINMEGVEVPEVEIPTQYFEKLTSAPTDWTGTYLIVFDDNKAHSFVSGSDLVSASNTALVINDNKIAFNNVTKQDAVVLSVKDGGYKLLLSNNKYLTVPSSNSCGNNADEAKASTLTLEWTEAGVKISGVDSNEITRYLCANGNYYRMYKSIGSYKLPVLFKLN